jgi:hypothetical protein
MKSVFYGVIAIILAMLNTGCTTINSVTPPSTEDISILDETIGSAFSCKCEYHKTKRNTYDRNKLNNFANIAYVYALMSSNAYDDEPQIEIPGWRRLERFETWKGFGADVYVSPNNHLAIAFRGTDGLSFNDWFWGNFNLSGGGQYDDADDFFKMLQTKYGKKPTIVTGHSLGGGLALHIAILNDKVDAYVFDSSPRVFVNSQYDNYDNNIYFISESGEALAGIRKIFTTPKKIKPYYYRYNYLGGNFVKEHGMQNFSQCMYKSHILTDIKYTEECKNKI